MALTGFIGFKRLTYRVLGLMGFESHLAPKKTIKQAPESPMKRFGAFLLSVGGLKV